MFNKVLIPVQRKGYTKEKSKNWQDYERGNAKDYAKAAVAEQKKADAAKKKGK